MANKTTIPEVWLPLIRAFVTEEGLRLELGRKDIRGNKIPMSKMNFFRISRGKQAPTVPQIEQIAKLCKDFNVPNPLNAVRVPPDPDPMAVEDLFVLNTIGRLLTADGKIPSGYDMKKTLADTYDRFGEDALIEIAADESKSLHARKGANYLINDYDRNED